MLFMRLARWEFLKGSVPGTRVLLSATVGLGLLSYSILAIGLLGWLYPGVIWGWLLVLAIGGIVPDRREVWRDLSEAASGVYRSVRRFGWPLTAGLLALLALAVLYLIGALAPPLGPDDLSYHFPGPQRYLESHRIVFVPDKYYTNLPFTVEMLWTVAIGIDSGELAQVVNWGMGLLVIGWVALLARSAGLDNRHAVLAALLFYSITTVGDQSISGSVELAGTMFFLAAVFLLLLWLSRERPGWLPIVIAGLLAGFYAGTKLPNPMAVALVTLWLVWMAWRRHSPRVGISAGVIFACVAAVVVGVWYLKSWSLTGNPVYPFLHSAFGGPPIRDELLVGDSTASAGKLWADSLTKDSRIVRLVMQPYHLIANPTSLRGYVGPLWLAVLPLGALFAPKTASGPTDVRGLGVLGLVYYLFWVPIYRLIRIGLPTMALMAPMAASGTIWLASQGRYFRPLVAVAIVGWLGVSMVSAARDVAPALPVTLGLQSVDDYLLEEGPVVHNFVDYDAILYMNTELPEDAKVLYWGAAGYYLEVPHVYALEFLATLADGGRIYDPDQVLGELRRFDISHVAMTDEAKRARLRQTLEETGALNCLFTGRNMVVCELLEQMGDNG